ncbi:helix-turn-helix transcriptional regulator [Vibrio agarivorans]|uniref:Helix-turn-helix domain-containing protein n=1 Tax=Vibrio agarivorans TaxID=153622 RepID=A0ABT7Y0V5_9VIBR|nr:helix-turn-helix domain-containing protein [Vibrio agarivorans]MDN2481668.1 helix-turn-helix domain-containing protein [Vibrio agarivorans]
MKSNETVPHLGTHIRQSVIPQGMSVTKAAELLGVGRPALSNLLNGKASLSVEMAKRLEKAFSYSSKDLLAMQTNYSETQDADKEAPSNIKAYVPTFLALKANDIEHWASHNISARTRFPVFLRTLVNSTGLNLTQVDFPGNDDGERPGWDGFIISGEGTPWIPKGKSGWEFGVNSNVKGKADGDFDKSVKAISSSDRADMTFVFVTPRRWSGKSKWTDAKKNEQLWKDVRAYDASDLEQWLEQSLAGQAWFANETHGVNKGVRSLDKCWSDWADVSEPPLTGKLFTSAIQAAKRKVLSRLSKCSEGPTIVAADSKEEALAFVSQLLSQEGGTELAYFRDRVLVFDEPGTLAKLAESTQAFIPVVHGREVENELAPYAKKLNSIVIYPRNAFGIEPHVVLEPASYETFNKSMEDMGKSRDDIQRLAHESGRSLTVLRRRLAQVPSVRTPEWVSEHEIKVSLIPFLLVGAWHCKNEADRCGIELLAGDRSYSQLEREFQRLAQLNDSPVWMTDGYQGVVSKTDLLFAVGDALTEDDLTRFFDVTRMVLAEDNPALDLDENQRWAASMYGKTREFSEVFREGLSETLVLLSLHGDALFKGRFSLNAEVEVSKLVSSLLPSPLTTRTLEANDRDLPTYAEATPEVFLSILEADLKSENPGVFGLLKPASMGPFSHPSRTGLLWALEGLCWSPITVSRAVMILVQLAQIEIDDNWANKPIKSLLAVFRSWMPQTSANLETRIALVKRILIKYPDIGWKLCIEQFDTRGRIGDYSHKPKWRTDGYGYGEPLQDRIQVKAFIDEMVSLALGREYYSVNMLTDLLDRFESLNEHDQEMIWSIIENWAGAKAADAEKAQLREKIRVTVFSRRALKHSSISAGQQKLAKSAYDSLEPSDLLFKHSWLFKERWIEPSADEVDDIDSFDFNARDEKIKCLRISALSEIVEEMGNDGILALSKTGNTAWDIGWLCAKCLMNRKELIGLLKLTFQQVLDECGEIRPLRSLISGAIFAISKETKSKPILKEVAADSSDVEFVELLLLAPFRKSTWIMVDALSLDAQQIYWEKVEPSWIHECDEENNEGTERLMGANRPRAAFSCIQHHPEKLGVKILYRLLSNIATGVNEKSGQYMPDSYHITEAFKHINASHELSLEEKAGLEYAYIELLSSRFGGEQDNSIPNLERYIELHPELYVQAIIWTYKRNDGRPDPSEVQVSKNQIENLAKRGYHLLEAVKIIPGHNDLGELETERLRKWVTIVRDSCEELSRSEVGDLCIGKLLSASAIGKDDIWPCAEVREILEDIQSEDIMRGMCTGVYNSRGVTTRMPSDGGNQERNLAEKYREFGQKMLSSYPYVAAKLLFAIAESYERDAKRYDADASARLRLGR